MSDNKMHHLIKIKKNNVLKALKIIESEEKISRPELASKLNVTKTTISNIINDLIDLEVINEYKANTKVRGRKPTEITYNELYKKILTIEIKDDLKVIVFDFKMNVLFKKSYNFKNNIKQEIIEIIKDVILNNDIDIISISVLGVVRNDNEIMFVPSLKLSMWKLKDELEKIVSIPIFINNDANLCAMYIHEKYHYNDFCVAAFYEGVGFAALFDNKLFLGKNKMAGEVGHTIAVVDGISCPCNNNGCFEQYIGDQAFLRNYQLNMDDDIDLKDKKYQEYIQLLSVFFNNIHNTFSPQKIVVLSNILKKQPEIVNEIYKQIKCEYSDGLEIEVLVNNEEISLYGAFIVARNSLIQRLIDNIK